MFKKIIVKPTCIVVNNYTFGDAPQLENCFSMYNKVTHTITYDHISYDSVNKQLTLPRGIDISFVENVFGVRSFIESGCDNYRYNNTPTLIKHKPKNEKQEEAIRFLLSQREYAYTNGSSQLMLALDTGAGKTYLGIAYIAFMNMKTIIITKSTGWLEQWRDRMVKEHSNMTSREICFIKGTPSITSLFKKSKEELDDRYKIYMVTHSTLLSYANNFGWSKIRDLFIHLGIGIKVFDEAHLEFANIINIDYNTSTCKTLYLTATPSRGDENEDNIYKLYFKNVPKIILFDPENDPHTHYIAVRYKSGLSASEISRCMNRYGFSNTIYCDQVMSKKNFDYVCRVIFDFISKLRGKKLIFLATNNAVVYMQKWIMTNYPEYRDSVGIYTSINPDKEHAKDCHIILTTSKSAGAALDIKDLVCSVQLAEPMKSEPQNKQRFGRTRGYDTVYIDLVDESCAITKKYYINNLPMFDKYALSCKEIKFTDKSLERQAITIMNNRRQCISPFIKI